jgi:predicted nucleic acid-binding protein
MIVADTGAILALIDKSDRHHQTLLALFEDQPTDWILPWAILPEVDYLVGAHMGVKAQEAWLDDLATGAFQIEWGVEADLTRAREIARRHRALRIGLVDAIVVATAERLEAEAIATLDLRHFGAVAIKDAPRLVPRDRP